MTDEGNTSESEAVQSVCKALAPFSPEQRARIIGATFALLEISKIEMPENFGLLVAGNQTTGAGSDLSQLTIEAFMRSKRPTTVPQRLACLAYYLERHDHLGTVSAKNLRKANHEARQPSVDDMARDLSSAARRDRFFRKMDKQSYQLASLGIEVVESLPDQSQVKAVTAGHSKITRRKTKAKS